MSSDFNIPGGILQEGLYNFTAVVWRRTETEAQGASASVTVLLSASAPPPMVITTPWLNGSGVSTTSGWAVGPVATIRGSASCPIPAAASFRWALTGPAGQFVELTEVTGSWNESFASLTPPKSFDGALLVVGELYEYVPRKDARGVVSPGTAAGPVEQHDPAPGLERRGLADERRGCRTWALGPRPCETHGQEPSSCARCRSSPMALRATAACKRSPPKASQWPRGGTTIVLASGATHSHAPSP